MQAKDSHQRTFAGPRRWSRAAAACLTMAALARPPLAHGADSTTAAGSSTVLSHDDVIAFALAGSPQLRPFPAELRAREAETVQASLHANPELGVDQENFGGTGATGAWKSAETTVKIAQPIELGDEREQRVAVARLDRRLVEWDYAQARREVILLTAQAFVRTLAAQERLERARELVQVAEETRSTVARGVRAGAVSPVEERRATLDQTRATAGVERLARELLGARIALAATWGASEPTFSAVCGELAPAGPPPDLDELLRRSGELPEQARFDDELDRQRAAVALEQSRAMPDLLVGGGLRHFAEGDDLALVAQVALPLPIFDRNQGAVEAARRRVDRTQSQADAARAASRAEIRILHQELLATREQAKRLSESLLPEAEAVHRATRDAHERGLLRLTDVLDTQRALFDLRLEQVDANERYQRSAEALATILESARWKAAHPSDGDRP